MDRSGKVSSLLNEENCKEIINILIDKNYLKDVVHTLDGKGILTSVQLDKEILEELHSLNDRVSLLDLQTSLSVVQLIIHKRIHVLAKNK